MRPQMENIRTKVTVKISEKTKNDIKNKSQYTT